MQRCIDAGYKVGLVFFYLSSAEFAIERVRLRVSQGGHNVPEPDIIRRYYKGLNMFFTDYVPLADKVEVYDNSYSDIRLVADLTKNKIWEVHQPEIWQEIQRKIYEK
ncbi:MAG: hypothetical protein QM752_07305 [Gammaproteobacteria bacterium]